MRPILIIGARGAGKTTLIRRLLSDMSRPVRGFYTANLPTPPGSPWRSAPTRRTIR